MVHFNDIKVGDIVEIVSGMNIPCDGIMLNGSGVKANESAMTGESDEMSKDNLDEC